MKRSRPLGDSGEACWRAGFLSLGTADILAGAEPEGDGVTPGV